ncbi:hypothetical protein PRIEUP_LOCUS1563 [Pristimantis euphronides]
MADTTIGYQILFGAVGLSFLAGFLINVFIVAVNISEWTKGRSMSTTDKVITSLGISRMVFQVGCMFHVIWDVYFYRLDNLFFVPVLFLETTSIYYNIWLSTLLSVVFYLKISTLHNAFFLRLKTLVLSRVFHLIVVSVVVSVTYALVCCLITISIPYNSTMENYLNPMIGLIFSRFIFRTSGPCLIYFISSVLLIIYLYQHVSRMRSRRNETSHLDAYYKTIKFTGFSIFCSTCYSIMDLTSQYWLSPFGLLGFYFLWQLFPTFHSMYLIYVTAKFRIQLCNVVCVLRRCIPKASVETVFQ